MFGNRAQYSWGTDGEILWLKDHGIECRSLTNDLENCLTEIAGQIKKPLTGYKIIYRDSMGEWDGIVITEMGDKRDLEVALDWLDFSKEKGRPYWTDYLKINFFPIMKKKYQEAKEFILSNKRYAHAEEIGI